MFSDFGVGQDVRYAVRTLRRSPGFAIVAALTLALGIGATTAIYGVVDTILLKPLPFADADRLVRIAENVASSVPGHPPFQRGMTYQEFLDWRGRSSTLSDAFAVGVGENVARTSEGAARLWGATVSGNTFTVLGADAMLGRTLLPSDDSSPDVVVLSFETWRRLFHSQPDAVGTTLEFRADFNASLTPGAADHVCFVQELVAPRQLTIVGVMPATFELPTGPMDRVSRARRDRGRCSAHRLREHREPPAGARHDPAARDRGATRHRGQSCTSRASGPHRVSRARDRRRRARRSIGGRRRRTRQDLDRRRCARDLPAWLWDIHPASRT